MNNEKTIDAGVLSDGSRTLDIAICAVCKQRGSVGMCKVLGCRPADLRRGHARECEHFVLDQNAISFAEFQKFYPDFVKAKLEG